MGDDTFPEKVHIPLRLHFKNIIKENVKENRISEDSFLKEKKATHLMWCFLHLWMQRYWLHFWHLSLLQCPSLEMQSLSPSLSKDHSS